jgi:hypothetical protein
VDGTPVGLAPADGRWEYAGERIIHVSAPGYEPVTQRVRFKPKWHNYPPLDLFAEVLWPFRIEDVRRVRVDLPPAQPVNQAALVNAADMLRATGKGMRESVVPDTPARDRRPAAAAPSPPPTLPADVTRPFTNNLFPNPAVPVGPANPIGGDPTPAPANVPGVVPTGPEAGPGR